MKTRTARGKLSFTIFSVLAIISIGTFSWAVPATPPYDFSITPSAYHDTGPIILGNTLTFDDWWDIPDPSITGAEPWANVFIQRPDPTFGFVSLASYFTNTPSTGWNSQVIDTSAFAGQSLNIRFSITDYGVQDPDPTYYVRNLSTNVPEPSTLLLLGSGLLGLVGLNRRRKA